MTADILIGTSGWHYPHWRGVFFPQELPMSAWLSYYARALPCVEVNSTFYRTPRPGAIVQWALETPRDFIFAVKAPRTITHMKKLRDCREQLTSFLKVVDGLGDKLGPVLLQLPPRWRLASNRLHALLELVPDHCRFAFEFRDPSWHVPEVYALLRRYGAAFCIFDLAGFQSPEVLTADLVYVRLHGPHEAYAGSYSPRRLRVWAEKVRAWQAQSHSVFVFFDNDEAGYAVRNARTLLRYCDQF